MSEGESFTRRRGMSLRATPKRRTMVRSPWLMWWSAIPSAHSSAKNSRNLHRARREDQREHRAVEGVSLRRDVSSPGVQPSHHLRPRGPAEISAAGPHFQTGFWLDWLRHTCSICDHFNCFHQNMNLFFWIWDVENASTSKDSQQSIVV